jgi:uncharacterized membrane protein YfcA
MTADFSIQALMWLGVAIIAGGLVSGVLAGLFGIGGGAVLVPVLYEVFGFIGVPEDIRMHLCIGTSLAVIIPTSIRSFRAHRARGAVDMAALRIWAIPVVLGVVAGSLVAGFVPSSFLKTVFMVVGALIALKMLSGSKLRFADDLPGKPGMTAYGLGIGLLSSWMGIGGGSFGNLIYAMHNRPVHQGVATSSGLGVLIAIPGAIGYMIAGWPEMAVLPPASIGFVSLLGAVIIAPVSVLAAPIGVKLAHGWSKRRLEIALGTFLLLVSLRFAADLFT